MSNHLAAAAVTATLRKILQAACDAAHPGVSGANVTTLRPTATTTNPSSPGINVFLYQVTPNAQGRSQDLPLRRPDGSIVQRPQMALDLHYLISFTGDDAKLEPQFLLGLTTRVLHESAVIARQQIQDMLGDPLFDFMAGADLADAQDLVRLSMVPLSLEELSKLWSVVFQTPYLLSQVYRASVVVVDGLASPRPALPVRAIELGIAPSLGPVVTRVLSKATADDPPVENEPILNGQWLVLDGRDLKSGNVIVRIGDIELVPDAAALTPTRLAVLLPDAIQAGARQAVVVQRPGPAAGPFDAVSNSVQFTLQPRIVSVSFAAGNTTVTVSPPVGQRQKVQLLLNQKSAVAGSTPATAGFDAPGRATAIPVTTLVVPTPGLASGAYLARVLVDGAESPVAIDPATGRYGAPSVTVP